jgi:inosine-uridine nucleoside N-ribohydrolase
MSARSTNLAQLLFLLSNPDFFFVLSALLYNLASYSLPIPLLSPRSSMSVDHSGTSRRQFLGNSAATLVASSFATIPAFSSPAAHASMASRLVNASATPRRIILDTDPGVDDAMAIFLALRSPELKIEAITPVCGNVPLSLTLPNALRLLEIAGRTDIPVAGGASTPLVRRLITAKYVHGNNGLGGVEFPEPKIHPVAAPAVEVIRGIIGKNPGEITIVAVGPLTNIATVLKTDPSIATLIKEIVVMGGSLSGGNITPSAEFNFYVDPEAARIVFDAGVPITMVGLNVTEKVLLREAEVRTLEAVQNPVSQAAGKIMRATLERMRKGRDITVVAMHDPLTVAHLIDPTILRLKEYYVQIETTGELTAGESIAYSGASPVRRSPPMDTGKLPPEVPEEPFSPNSKVAVEVNAEKFFDLLLSRLTSS